MRDMIKKIDIHKTSIYRLDLDFRSHRIIDEILCNKNVITYGSFVQPTIGDIIDNITQTELVNYDGFGRKSLKVLKSELLRFGQTLRK